MSGNNTRSRSEHRLTNGIHSPSDSADLAGSGEEADDYQAPSGPAQRALDALNLDASPRGSLPPRTRSNDLRESGSSARERNRSSAVAPRQSRYREMFGADQADTFVDTENADSPGEAIAGSSETPRDILAELVPDWNHATNGRHVRETFFKQVEDIRQIMGLSNAELNHMPTTTISDQNHNTPGPSNCGMCGVRMAVGETVMLFHCAHDFHVDCARRDLAILNHCPFDCARPPHLRLPSLSVEQVDEETGRSQLVLRDPQTVLEVQGVPFVFLRN